MRSSPPMVPEAGQDTSSYWTTWAAWAVYGAAGEDANHETLIRDLLEDQYSRPIRIVVAFNTTEGWSRDITLPAVVPAGGRCVVWSPTGFDGACGCQRSN